MQSILVCISSQHDQRLLLLAVCVCVFGVYGTCAMAIHAGRGQGRQQIWWRVVSIVAAGSTAWATHMIALLAFNPGMMSGFDPLLTFASLFAAILGIGAGVGLAIGSRDRRRRFFAGVVLGLGVTVLHYMGQAAYVVVGHVTWDRSMVGVSIVVSLAMFGTAMVAFGERRRSVRIAGAPLLLASIAVLHFCGMTAAKFTFDPKIALPSQTVSLEFVAPIVAAVSFCLLALAVIGLRFTLAARVAARRDRQRLRELASVAVEGLAICDGENIATANRSLELLTGAAEGSLSGQVLASILPGLDTSGLPEHEERDAELLGADGQFVPVRVLRRSVLLGGKRQTVFAVRDQRERLETELKIRTLAYCDSLTGLPNRARFNDLVATHAAAARGKQAAFSILLIDLDRFASINDTLGQAAADAVLRQVAQRLPTIVSSRYIVARLDGDEFAVIHFATAGAQSSGRLAKRIIEAIGRPLTIEGQTVEIGASVGVVTAPHDGNEPFELLRNARLALNKAKADGRNLHRCFEPELGRQASERQQMERDLRHALEAGEFAVHYQPLFDACSLEITGAEALVRWRHPTRGLVPPSDFIALAEETGLIASLGQWVLAEACAEAASWPSNIRVAVNVSPAQLRDPNFLESVLDILWQTVLPADRLELELTEGVLLLDEVRTLTTLGRLRKAGIGLAMDDFGTGYSSLSYLRRFPFSKVKIDRSFVRNLPADQQSAAIIRAIVSLATTLGMSTVIEGVETFEQHSIAVAEGCKQIQGFFLSRPLTGEDFRLLLSKRDSVAA